MKQLHKFYFILALTSIMFLSGIAIFVLSIYKLFILSDFTYLFIAIITPILCFAISSPYVLKPFTIIILGIITVYGYINFAEPWDFAMLSLAVNFAIFKTNRILFGQTGNYLLFNADKIFLRELLTSDWYNTYAWTSLEQKDFNMLFKDLIFEKHVASVSNLIWKSYKVNSRSRTLTRSDIRRLFEIVLSKSLPYPFIETKHGTISTSLNTLIYICEKSNGNPLGLFNDIVQNDQIELLLKDLGKESISKHGRFLAEEVIDKLKHI
jgi:hypothetical protein